MNDTIHDVSGFFHRLEEKKKSKGNDNSKYITVCTEKESSRNRCYVSSNGLR